MKTPISVFVALVLCLALAPAAFGQSSIQGYDDQAGQIHSEVSGDTTDSVAAATTTSGGDGGGSLPFTGLDVALLVGSGGLLVAVGLGMRRLTRAPDAG